MRNSIYSLAEKKQKLLYSLQVGISEEWNKLFLRSNWELEYDSSKNKKNATKCDLPESVSIEILLI